MLFLCERVGKWAVEIAGMIIQKSYDFANILVGVGASLAFIARIFQLGFTKSYLFCMMAT